MNILSKDFKYTPAAKTDIRKTFAKARREINAARQHSTATASAGLSNESLGRGAVAVAAPIQWRKRA